MKLSAKNNKFFSKLKNLKKELFLKNIERARLNQPGVQKWLIIFFLSVILCLIISSRIPSYKQYVPGEIAALDVKAPQDFLVEDNPSTIAKTRKAVDSVWAVYDFDLNAIAKVEQKIDLAFKTMSESFSNKDKEKIEKEKIPKEEFEQLLGITISGSSFKILEKRSFNLNILNYIYRILNNIFEQGVVSNREILMEEKNRGIVIRFFPNREETNVQEFSRFMDITQARSRVKREARILIPSSERSLEKPVVEIAQGLLRPNLTFNKSETEERKTVAREAVKPALFEVKKGEIIIRAGEKVTSEHLLKLAELKQLKIDRNSFVSTLGNFFAILLILSIGFSFSTAELAKKFRMQNKDLFFAGIMLILTTLMFQIDKSLPAIKLLFLSDQSVFFAIPVATGAIVVSVVLGVRHCLVFSVLISVLSIMVFDYKIECFIYPFIGSLVGAREAVHANKRSTLLKAGLWVSLANIIVIICLKLKVGDFVNWEPLMGDLAMGFSSGILSGIIATGFVPLIEVIFSYTTDIKLLELGNLNHPLLKELIINAPGTYHHSIITGSLVEAAAEAIGANPLMARVGAYYHDIGKIKKPIYFIENQEGVENRHDNLSPNMSGLILISHVKDGIEKAKSFKLGKVITDIIQQHHGTNLINYFYKKAKERDESSESGVDEKNFRYPGPKPQTKEAGLVMLADALEASSRTLTEPTPARIQGLVQRTINNFFTDGQLDECELTLKDLHLIAKSFNRILTGIFHHRIKYPAKSSLEPSFNQKNNENMDQELSEEAENRLKNGQEDSESELKRLGIS